MHEDHTIFYMCLRMISGGNVIDLPIVSSTDYKAASPVELNIKDGGNLVCGVVCVAKHSLHALKLRVRGQLNLTTKAGRELTRPLLDFGQYIRFLEFLALVCLAI